MKAGDLEKRGEPRGTGAITHKKEHNWTEKRLSLFERLPYEVMSLILSQVPYRSLTTCALTSSQLHFAVTEPLYATVHLESDRLTRTFADTLLRRPSLCNYVRKLRIAVNPHWESVRRLHEILKRLPNLVDLHVLPSWITYGDLPYWEYPFKLRKIKWGLIKDRASQRFIASQSDTLKEIGYLKLRVE
jgi:hypothetical protein